MCGDDKWMTLDACILGSETELHVAGTQYWGLMPRM
jgi:hypothetical protein